MHTLSDSGRTARWNCVESKRLGANAWCWNASQRNLQFQHNAGTNQRISFSQYTPHISYDLAQIAPFILTPTAFPRKEFEKAVGLQVTLNELMHWVAHDHQFLEETLKQTIKVDEFTAGLYRIYESVHEDGTHQVIFSVLLYIVRILFWL